MAATYEIDLNLKPGGIPQRVHLNQYDKGQKITVNLYNDNTIYTPVGTVWVSGTKKDNTGFQYQCEKSGSSAVITVTDQMTCYPGDTEVEVTDVKEGVKQGSANFILSVENAAFHDDTAISETDIPAVQKVAENIDKVESWKDETKLSADAAKESQNAAESAKIEAQSAQAAAEKARDDTSQIKADTSALKDQAASNATLSQSYAKGGTGTRDGEDTDNALFYKSAAETARTGAETAQTETDSIKSDVEKLKSDVEELKTAAASSATLSESYAKGSTGTRDGEDIDNAKAYAAAAKASAEAASSGMKVATATTAGAVQPDNRTIVVSEKGVISVPSDVVDLGRTTQGKTTVFNADGSITETLTDGSKRVTSFDSEEKITSRLYGSDGTLKETTTTTFNGDTITEEVK